MASQVNGDQPSSPSSQPQEVITSQPSTPSGTATPLLHSNPLQIVVPYLWPQPYGKVFHGLYTNGGFFSVPKSSDVVWNRWINGNIPPVYGVQIFTSTQKPQVRRAKRGTETSHRLRVSRVPVDLRFGHKEFTLEDTILLDHETTIEVCLKVKPVISSTFAIIDLVFKLVSAIFPLAKITGVSPNTLNYISCALSLLAFFTVLEETFQLWDRNTNTVAFDVIYDQDYDNVAIEGTSWTGKSYFVGLSDMPRLPP
ncbi:hypothetical protein TWF970_001236 [Orbilia oligospora]|uniref:Uncharacterized protein n=1 Tax=Orbilia oligospora TaxID=2813651 RepID=A0A7C8VKL8_ORBOL|nr:hypothetical protein TWF970_001236 [Orbilia oligospora]